MRIIVSRTGIHETVRYASDELVRYMKKIDSTLVIDERVYKTYESLNEDIIWIGQYHPFVAPDENTDEILI